MENLERYYTGDKNWFAFVKLYDELWENNKEQLELLTQLNNHLDLAKVIYGKFNTNAIKWINFHIPALDYLTPLNCLESEELIKRLRECLMRMPS